MTKNGPIRSFSLGDGIIVTLPLEGDDGNYADRALRICIAGQSWVETRLSQSDLDVFIRFLMEPSK